MGLNPARNLVAPKAHRADTTDSLGLDIVGFKPRRQMIDMSAPDAPQFMDTLNLGKQMPFELPSHSWLQAGIGNTPMAKLSKNTWAKLEGHNPGGSLKDRTLSSIVFNMLKEGKLRLKGDTLTLVTSGSAGFSLCKMHSGLSESPGLELGVIIVMPKAYAKKEIPTEIIELDNTTVFEGAEALLADIQETGGHNTQARVMLMDGVFMDVLAETREIAKKEGWTMVDQHYDTNAMDGHKSTAIEIMMQVPTVTDVVCATGTGATAAGLLKHLPSNVNVHARPALSGSIDGLSDVKRYDNFCDTTKLKGYSEGIFELEDAQTATMSLKSAHNVVGGPSMGATYWLAKPQQGQGRQHRLHLRRRQAQDQGPQEEDGGREIQADADVDPPPAL
jgi:cysteine synthase